MYVMYVQYMLVLLESERTNTLRDRVAHANSGRGEMLITVIYSRPCISEHGQKSNYLKHCVDAFNGNSTQRRTFTVAR